MGCFGDAFGEGRSEVGGYKDGGGVEQDDVAARAAFAREDGFEDGGVGGGIASAQSFDGSALEADLFGSESAEGDGSVADFGDLAGA